MLIIKTVEELKKVLFLIRSNGKSVGFVPTMGALHEGHLSLAKKARCENEVVVCSIFVNPLQFNNSSDLASYPRSLDADVALLDPFVDIVFAPSVEELLSERPQEEYHFEELESVMEGVARPGHFNGVVIIVKLFLSLVDPDKAYFGEKDYQQLLIIKQLVKQEKFKVDIIACPIIRDENGLALSSRNKLLTEQERLLASRIHVILQTSKKYINVIQQAKEFVIQQINLIPEFKLDYFEIADQNSLQKTDNSKNAMGFIAVYIGKVRLIDNIKY
ncbi:MAG: pantoate--beta-alanine ligase [Bacteroidales bacterium]|jgi:pantoate--beta-alanine ligase|nr:pantoate--beta-alanine ligase [Bacteroidales bacterium]